jgi:hypothetical protein
MSKKRKNKKEKKQKKEQERENTKVVDNKSFRGLVVRIASNKSIYY